MSKCTWDPSKHGGQQCPVHGAGGADADYKEGSKRISGGKYQISKDRKNYEEVNKERYNSLDIDEEEMDGTLDSDISQEGSSFKNKQKLSENEYKKLEEKYVENGAKVFDTTETVDGKENDLTLLYQDGKHVGTYNRTTGEFFNDEDEDFDKDEDSDFEDDASKQSISKQMSHSQENKIVDMASELNMDYEELRTNIINEAYDSMQNSDLSVQEAIDEAINGNNRSGITQEDKKYKVEEMRQKSKKYNPLSPGGVKGDLERVGFDDIEVVDNKTLKFRGPDNQEGWTIKENNVLGFDVYDSEGNKVIDDINANRESVAAKILQYEQNKGNRIDVRDFDVKDRYGVVRKVYLEQINENLKKAKTKEDFEDISDKIDALTEKGIISETKADELYNQLDKKIDEVNEQNKISKKEREKEYRKSSESIEDKQHKLTSAVGKFIDSDGSDQELDEMVNELRKSFSDEEIIKKIAMMFKGTIK